MVVGNVRGVKSTFLLWSLLCIFSTLSGAWQQAPAGDLPTAEDEGIEELAASVMELGLGAGEFVVGSHLTGAQAGIAKEKLLTDTYPGTIKFSSGDVFVVADEESHLILAVYKRLDEVHADEVREMVGHLMTRFGEPTTMAHGKLIYWAFSKAGKIDGEAYREAKAQGEIDILATVKFNSTLEVNPGMDNENTEETGTIYYIITSDRLLNSYLTSP